MLRVHSINEVNEFVDPQVDPENYQETLRGLWETGAGRPEWSFAAEEDGTRVGRVGFVVEPTTSDPAWLGTLPPNEMSVYGLQLPWDGDWAEVGFALFREAARRVVGSVPETFEMRIVEGVHDNLQARRRLAEAIGMEIFSEKQGYQWLDDGRPIDQTDRLTFRSVADIGIESYRSVMAPCGLGTLDRNDHYYWTGCGPDNWAMQMTEYVTDEDADMWLVGYAGDTPVGYVAVARDDDLESTIAHIGVIPEHRGNGYVSDLLAAGTEVARVAGIKGMLSDVDVLNEPMSSAMIRSGHLPNRRPWHVWAYRARVSDLAG